VVNELLAEVDRRVKNDKQSAVRTLPVEIWLIDFVQPEARVGQYMGVLNEPEKRRAERFAFEVDRSRYVAGRYAMRSILARRLRTRPVDVPLGLGEYDKPVLLEEHGFRFNLSHTDELAVLALVGHDSAHVSELRSVPEVGVDIERAKPLLDPTAMYRHCLCERERQCLMNLDEADRQTQFFEIWVRKEAALKALGLGFEVEPHSFDSGWSPAAVHSSCALIGSASAPYQGESANAIRIGDRAMTMLVPLDNLEFMFSASPARNAPVVPVASITAITPMSSIASGAPNRLHGAVSLVNAIPVPSFRCFEFEEG
jgi:4'-phosphopantetheinyl transferase